MPHLSQFRIRDYSDEYSNVSLFNGAITAVSIAGFLTEFGDLRDAIAAIILGNVAQESWIGDRTTVNDVRPASTFAQRELKWLVEYHGDTTLKKFTLTIPTADPTGRLIAGTDLADLSETDMAAFVAAFETTARSPDDDTETVTVDAVRLVGRNI